MKAGQTVGTSTVMNVLKIEIKLKDKIEEKGVE